MYIISQNTFLYLGILACLCKSKIIFLNIFMKYKKINYYELKEEFIRFIFNVYIFGVISKVYFPLTIAWGEHVNYRPPVIILNPIESLIMIFNKGGIDGFTYNILGNLLLLVPMGCFIYYYYRNKINNYKSIMAIPFLISLFIECSQLILSLLFPNVVRYFEVNDLLLNTIGGIMGYILARVILAVEYYLKEFFEGWYTSEMN